MLLKEVFGEEGKEKNTQVERIGSMEFPRIG